MFSSNAFDYINVLDKAADASWARNEAIANNLANATTPNYKRQDVAFESELKKALGSFTSSNSNSSMSMDHRVEKINSNLSTINGKAYIDGANYSYRLDGNNVDPETENIALAENQLKYQGLLASISQEFQNLKSVMQ